MSDQIIESLGRAVQASPDDIALRLHLADLLVGAGRGDEAVAHCATVLQQDPTSGQARALMARALGGGAPTTPPAGTMPAAEASTSDQAPVQGGASTGGGGASTDGYDWSAAEEQFPDAPGPMFVEPAEGGVAGAPGGGGHGEPQRVPVQGEPAGVEDLFEVERAGVTLADVGGMQEVKDRLEVSFLGPMRSPEMRRMYGKSLRGGLLLYGPPGVGKTYIARAVAGEMGAGFINVRLSDVLDMYIGQSEGNLHGLFELARRSAPAVLFLDEVDAIGQKRTRHDMGAMRGVVNQLLQELDGVGSDNDGVYVLAATNAPWDIDPALRRPGRLDRTLLVLPPDDAAREQILRGYLSRRPVEGVDLRRLVKGTDGLTGADLAHLVDTAAERAMMDSVRSGTPRMITQRDLEAALGEVRPSTGAWFSSARNVVTYGDPSGEYGDLRTYMKGKKLL
ncbi:MULTISPECIES: tetratricopeptide repeat protein [Kytococcus]|uniref:tetratricopeptide repeat protein n=1 Tax=Kytococcus TaxID=57499 RepID=UPI0008A5D2A5|nr:MULTISPECIES: tetratricopeptide repeat protein [Kytococcus]OFS06449.1 AAA family ATPase [Kytococcus sp. HMSC28H12]